MQGRDGVTLYISDQRTLADSISRLHWYIKILQRNNFILQRCNPDVNKLKWTFPEELKLFLEILSFREKFHVIDISEVMFLGVSPPFRSDSLSQKWKRHTLPWLILTLFVRDALEAIYQNWFGNSFLLLSLISMLTEQLKFAQIFPITNVSDLSFSDWEYQLTKDPRIPTHVYMLFIIMIG